MAPWDEVNLAPHTPPPSNAPPFATSEAEYHAYQPTPPPQPYHIPEPYPAPMSAYSNPAPAPAPNWPARAPNPDSLLGRTAAKAQKTNGDDLYGTETIATTRLNTIRRRGRTGWLLALLSLAALAAVVALGFKERQKLLSEQAKQRDALAQIEARVKTAQEARLQAEQKLEAVKSEATAKETASTDDQKLIGDLKSLLTAKEGEIEAAGKTVTVSLVDDVMFPSGRSELALPGFRILARLGKILKEAPDRQIVIGGHTDDRPLKKKGGFETNWELSAARAVNVVRYLVEEVGLPPGRISAAAYSQYKPRSKNLAKNRRIEVLLTPTVKVKTAR